MAFATLADRAVCINLLEREDRLEHAKTQFASVGLDDAVVFHRVNRHARGGKFGCYDSHRSVIRQAYDDGLERVLIFEDDVHFDKGWEQVVVEAKAFLDSGTPWDALFLGCELRFVDEKTFPNIWRVKCIHAHAYIVSRQGMSAFLAHSDKFGSEIDHYPQDVVQNSVWQNMYGHTSTSIAQDDDFGTDLNWLPDIPEKYTVWFQTVIVTKYGALLQPVIRSSWYRRSWFGQRFLLGLDHCIIDDGRIKLKGLWFIDLFVIGAIALVSKPPYGYATFFRDVCIEILPALRRRVNLDGSSTKAV